tara:strand:- start:174 stop:338 length:165 start_codon:yes stop_codon:yes gene_type:complete
MSQSYTIINQIFPLKKWHKQPKENLMIKEWAAYWRRTMDREQQARWSSAGRGKE